MFKKEGLCKHLKTSNTFYFEVLEDESEYVNKYITYRNNIHKITHSILNILYLVNLETKQKPYISEQDFKAMLNTNKLRYVDEEIAGLLYE